MSVAIQESSRVAQLLRIDRRPLRLEMLIRQKQEKQYEKCEMSDVSKGGEDSKTIYVTYTI